MRRLTPPSLAELLALALTLALAGSASASYREVGYYTDYRYPPAGCPDNCQAIGGITGFQVQIGTHKNPFLIKRKGKITAFSIKLGKPNAEQTQFFTNLFGGKPSVRLSLLK